MIDDLVIDYFAGGGGASEGIEQAIGRAIDAAINHDPEAIAMHKANHPGTRHYCQSVHDVDPRDIVRDLGGGRVGLVWFSPDCKHFSKAKGGKPVQKQIRDLAWVAVKCGDLIKPDVIMLENVEEFQTWCPLIDGQPDFTRKGETFRAWVKALEGLGYIVEWRELKACDYGVPTTRKRLFVIARRDGKPIVWPAPTHGKPDSAEVMAGRLLPWPPVASVIDWSVPCPSIFERKRPLVEGTCRRIAAGVMKYVVNAGKPFIVPITNGTWSKEKAWSGEEPLRTITTSKGGEYGVVCPYTIAVNHGDSGGKRHYPITEPSLTATQKAGTALVAAFMAQHNTGVIGHKVTAPLSTITARGTQQAVVTSHLEVMRRNANGRSMNEPLPTITAGGTHMAEVRAFLVKYYGQEKQLQGVDEPVHTIPTKERFGLVTCSIEGVDYVIVDIGMRMLTPRELFRAQGFPDTYQISPVLNGKPITKTASIGKCGNSVPPGMSKALVAANFQNTIPARAAA